MVKGIIVGILLGLLLALIGVYYYFSSGRAPVAVTAPEMPLERKFASMALHRYLDKLPHPNPPVPQEEAIFVAGAQVYKEHCAVCHGLPGEPKSVIAAGMFPSPPQLFHGMGVTDDEPWETYWKVANGIRMTGMPGFKERLSETQMWQVSVLVKNADNISPAVKGKLAAPAGVVTVPLVPSGAPTTPEHVHDHDH
jgi:mono/diheme cytochrome c family protein